MEDQAAQKRCGPQARTRPWSRVTEMVDRIKAAVDARDEPSSSWPAPTPWRWGLGSALERAAAYVEAGADMIFAEAVTELDQYDRFRAGGRGADPRQHDRVRQDGAV